MRNWKFLHWQGCALRKIDESPDFWTYEIQGAQYMNYNILWSLESKVRFSSRPGAKLDTRDHRALLEHSLEW